MATTTRTTLGAEAQSRQQRLDAANERKRIFDLEEEKKKRTTNTTAVIAEESITDVGQNGETNVLMPPSNSNPVPTHVNIRHEYKLRTEAVEDNHWSKVSPSGRAGWNLEKEGEPKVMVYLHSGMDIGAKCRQGISQYVFCYNAETMVIMDSNRVPICVPGVGREATLLDFDMLRHEMDPAFDIHKKLLLESRRAKRSETSEDGKRGMSVNTDVPGSEGTAESVECQRGQEGSHSVTESSSRSTSEGSGFASQPDAVLDSYLDQFEEENQSKNNKLHYKIKGRDTYISCVFGQFKFVNTTAMEEQVLKKIEEKMFPETKDQTTKEGRNASLHFKANIYPDLKKTIKQCASSRRNTVRIAVEKKVLGKYRRSEMGIS